MNESYYPPRLSGFFTFLLSATIFLASIVFMYSRLLLTPTPSPALPPTTSNWKAYSNYEFSFQYPPNWPDPVKYEQSTRYELGFGETIFITSGSYYNQTSQRNLTLQEYTNNFNRPSTDYNLGGHLGKRFSYFTADKKLETDIVVATNPDSSHIFIISLISDPNDTIALKTFDQILSSLRFLNDSDEALNKAVPISNSPAAGICPELKSMVVNINLTITPDNITQPRCFAIRKNQLLAFTNNTSKILMIVLGSYSISVPPGEKKTINKPVENYLLPGVHIPQASPEVPVPEIWLKN